MKGFENRQRTVDCTLVALMTKRGGSSGRSCKWPRETACRRKLLESLSKRGSVRTRPRARIRYRWCETRSCEFRRPRWRYWPGRSPSLPRFFQCSPRTPAVIDPPETLEMRSSLPKYLASFKRMRVPTWNNIARYPPPERQRPIAFLSGAGASFGVSLTGDCALCGW